MYCDLKQVIVIQFPKVIQDKTSDAYNKGQTFINEKNPKAFEACGGAFQTNLQKFFVHRATELVSGGILILIFTGRWTNPPTTKINDGSPHPSMNNFRDIAEASWEDLIYQVGDFFNWMMCCNFNF